MRACLLISLVLFVFLPFSYGENQKKGMAVLVFKEIGNVSKGSGETIANQITNRLKLDKYYIVERTRLSDILKEKLIKEGSVITNKDIASLKHLGVSYVMIGNISKIDNRFYGGYRIVDVNNAIIGESDSIAGAKNFEDLNQKIIYSLIRKGFVQARDKIVIKLDCLKKYKRRLHFGILKQKKYGEVYKAKTDGFVQVIGGCSSNTGSHHIYGYTDGNNPPKLRRAWIMVWDQSGGVSVQYNTFLMPIRKGDYWKIAVSDSRTTATVYWLSLKK